VRSGLARVPDLRTSLRVDRQARKTGHLRADPAPWVPSGLAEPATLPFEMSGAIADEHEPMQAVEPGQAQAKVGLLDELLDLDGRNATVPVATALGMSGMSSMSGMSPAASLGTRVGRFVGWTVGEAPTVEFAGNDRGPLAARSIIMLDPRVVAAAIAEHRGVLLTFEDGRPDAPIITGLLQPLIHLGPEPEHPKPETPKPTPEPDKPEPISPPEPEPPFEPRPGGPSQPGPEFEPPTGPEYDPPTQPEFDPTPGPEFDPPAQPEFDPTPGPEFDPTREPEQVEFVAGTSELESLDMRVDGRRVEIEAADEIVLRCGEACIVLRRNGRVIIRGTYVETRSRGVNRIKGGSVEIN
jgi:hypothetical protein